MKYKNLGLLIKSFLTGYRGEWDSICKGCGACCYQKNETDEGVIYIDFNSPCTYLDTYTNQCTVYENRFKICKDCSRLGARHALFARWLPPDCGYVETFRKEP